MVEVKNVSKQYGGKTVLEKTSLSIQKGQAHLIYRSERRGKKHGRCLS